MSEFDRAVSDVIRSIRRGDVMTYGEVAEHAGFPGAARAVGRLLRSNDLDLPWWRVLGAGGRLIAPSTSEQARLLRAEGWNVARGAIRPR